MKITREELDEYARLNTERKAIDKQSRTLAARCKQIEAAVEEQLIAEGKNACKRYGYQLALVEGRISIAWKDEFIRAVGPEKAAELQAAAPVSTRVTITAPPE